MKTAFLIFLNLFGLLLGGAAAFAGGSLPGAYQVETGAKVSKQAGKTNPASLTGNRQQDFHTNSGIAEPDTLVSEEEDEDLLRKLIVLARYALFFCIVLIVRAQKDKLPYARPAHLHLYAATPRFLQLRVIRI